MAKEVITIIRCDQCGKEINNADIRKMRIDFISDSQFALEYELCPVCYKKIRDMFKVPPMED